jgi:hypothetical protein
MAPARPSQRRRARDRQQPERRRLRDRDPHLEDVALVANQAVELRQVAAEVEAEVIAGRVPIGSAS